MSENKLLGSQNIRIEYDNILYLVKEEENTAGVIGFREIQEHIFIPRSIKIGPKEYNVTSILPKAFEKAPIKFVEFASDSKLQNIDELAFALSKIENITIPSSVTIIGKKAFSDCRHLLKIEFPNDSKLQTIGENVFSGSSIECITIPSELVNLGEGWCHSTKKINKIKVSPYNPKYRLYDEQMIIGKTKIEQSNYDCLVFCVRNIKRIKIPSFIEHICSNSFNYCEQLESVEFSDDSKLQTINESAFFEAKIESIKIPSSATLIGKYAFGFCRKLHRIEIPNNSKLQTIEECAFSWTSIESITIPSELVDLKDGWCRGANNITKISVSPYNPKYCLYDEKMIIGKTKIEQSNYDCLVFCVRNIKSIKIPSFIEHICSCSFENCKQLESIEFSNDSKIQTIEKNAFTGLKMKSFTIPSSVTLIGENAFEYCKFQQIEIPNNSELQTIEKNAFCWSSIESITFPSELVNLRKGWCHYTSHLTRIMVSPYNPKYRLYDEKMIIGKTKIEQSNYDCLVFCVRNIKRIKIPSFIEHICSCSFEECKQLESVEFSNDSKLQTIDHEAFRFSTIKSFIVPSSVTLIGEMAFYGCKELKKIEIPNNSKLQLIDQSAFWRSNIKSITIPSSVTFIGESTFLECGLTILEINNPDLLFKYSFKDCENAVIMIPVHS